MLPPARNLIPNSTSFDVAKLFNATLLLAGTELLHPAFDVDNTQVW